MKGKVPASVAPYLCGARLHAGKKKSAGIKPIAVGNLLRRLTSKCAASHLAHRAAVHFSPHQLGVGVPGGCEAIVNATREALAKEPSKLLLLIDLINAFNQADRGIVLLILHFRSWFWLLILRFKIFVRCWQDATLHLWQRGDEGQVRLPLRSDPSLRSPHRASDPEDG